MNTTVFNEAQLEMLQMMSAAKTPEMLKELKQAVSDFFARKLRQEIDRMWDDGELTDQKVENFRNLHERTPYKQ